MAWVQDDQGNWYDDGSSNGTTTDYSSYVDPFNQNYQQPTYNPSQGVDYSQMFGLDPNMQGSNPVQQTGTGNAGGYNGVDYSQYLNASGPSWLQQLQGYGGSAGGALGGIGSLLGMNGGSSGASSGSSGIGGILGSLAGAVGGSGNLGALGGALVGGLGRQGATTSGLPDWSVPYYQQGMQSAQPVVNDTLAGKYLTPDSNPYLKQYADAFSKNAADSYARGTSAQTMGQFQNAGAFGGTAMQETQAANNQAFQDSTNQALSGMFGNAYNQERSNQNGMANNLYGLPRGATTTPGQNGLAGALGGALTGYSLLK